MKFASWDRKANFCARLVAALPAKAVRVKREPKLPRSITRVPEIERNIAVGQRLLALRLQSNGNKEFSALRQRDFPKLNSSAVSDLMRVARRYGDKPLIWRRLSWCALIELSSTVISEPARRELEARILAGDRIRKPEIRAARGPLSNGRPRRGDQQVRMAA